MCHEQVAQLRDATADIEARGARLRIVGNGSVEFARSFAVEHQLEEDVFTDPERSVYSALGMARNLGATFSLGTLTGGVRAFRRGYRQKQVQGDPWQQGGVVIVSQEDELLFEHINQHAGDHPRISDILSAIR